MSRHAFNFTTYSMIFLEIQVEVGPRQRKHLAVIGLLA